MKRKIIYSLIASVMFVAPIWYWLSTWWGLSISRPPSLRRMVYIYSNDRTIVTITAINLVLYLLAMWKILTLRSGNRGNKVVISGANNAVGGANGNGNGNTPVVPQVVQNGSATDISRWEALYGNGNKSSVQPTQQKSNPQSTVAVAKGANAVGQTQSVRQTQQTTQSQVQQMPQTRMPDMRASSQQQVQATAQSVSSEQRMSRTMQNAGDSKVVSIAPVTANDVYRIQIKNMLADGGYESLGDCVVNGVAVEFIAVAESDTFVVGFIDSEYGEIVANDVAPIGEEPSVWYSGEHRYNSPVWEAKNVATAVKKMIDEVLPNDNGIEVVPVVVVPNATITNAGDVSDVWQEIGVNVVRFMNRTELPDLMDVLPDKSGTDVLDSYKTFAVTLMKYFKGKSGGKVRKVAN